MPFMSYIKKASHDIYDVVTHDSCEIVCYIFKVICDIYAVKGCYLLQSS